MFAVNQEPSYASSCICRVISIKRKERHWMSAVASSSHVARETGQLAAPTQGAYITAHSNQSALEQGPTYSSQHHGMWDTMCHLELCSLVGLPCGIGHLSPTTATRWRQSMVQWALTYPKPRLAKLLIICLDERLCFSNIQMRVSHPDIWVCEGLLHAPPADQSL